MHNRSLHTSRPRRLLVVASALCFASALTGCGTNGGSAVATHATSGLVSPSSKAWGQVHGGNLPVTGATVSLYVAGATGTAYGSDAALLAYTTTDSTGSFNFLIDANSTYVCPTPTALTAPAVALPLQAYLVVTGGNPGLSAGVTNPGLTMMAALGNCPAGNTLAASVPFVDIDEVTTVAAVWALQQFMAPPSAANSGAPQIGAPSTIYSNGLTGTTSYTNSGGTTTTANNAMSVQTAVQGMNNAFVTAGVLASIATGTSPNPTYNAYATPESAKINTLADILAYCINSNPSTTTNCSNFYTAATPTVPSGQYTATDIVQAAWYMAQNPTHSISTLYGYIPASGAPFLPKLLAPGGSTINTAYFNDTTVAINYAPYGPASFYVENGNTVNTTTTAYALLNVSDVSIDAYGNAWFLERGNVGVPANGIGAGGCPTGTPTCGVGGGVSELGIDGSLLGNQLNAYKPVASGGIYSLCTQNSPNTASKVNYQKQGGQMAIDLANRPWVADLGMTYNNTTTGSVATSPVACKATFNGTANTAVGIGLLAVSPASTQAGLLGSGNATAGVGGNATYNNAIGYYVGAAPWGLAIDGNNNIFMSLIAASNYYNSLSVAKMSATDASGYTVTAAASLPPTSTLFPQAFIDVDANTSVSSEGAVWVADTGCPVTGSLYSGNQSGGTGAVAPYNVTNYGTVSQFNGATLAALSDNNIVSTVSGAATGAGSATNCGYAATYNIGQTIAAYTANIFDIAVGSGGVWISDQYLTSNSTKSGFDGLTYLTNPAASTGLLPSAYYTFNGVLPSAPASATVGVSGTTLTQPARLAVDGNGNVWVANSAVLTPYGSVTEATFTGTGISFLTPGAGAQYMGNTSTGKYGIGFQHVISGAGSLAVDPSGNVWITNNDLNQNDKYTTNNGYTNTPIYVSTTVIVGAAAPVITPKALAVKYNKIGQKP